MPTITIQRWLPAALLSVFGACLLTPAYAQNGEVHGRVSDQSGTAPLEGALISIGTLGRETVSGRGGRYRLGQLPPGEHSIEVRYVGANAVTAQVSVEGGGRVEQNFRLGEDRTTVDNILVIGQAGGQAAALNRQRAADNVTSIVSADSIGQFPDQNVAEALRRLPGVSIANDQGEGRYVVIRGVDPALSSTTINGMRVPGPEDDSRQVNLDVISTDLLETLEVAKTVTPDMDGDSVGGNVEIRTLSAFDRGNLFSLRTEGSYNSLRSETSPKLGASLARTFSLGDGWENFGIAASVSWFRRDFGSDNIEPDGWPELDTPDGGEVRGMEEAAQRIYDIQRERLSGALSLDLRPSDDSEFFVRTLYSEFVDAEVRLQNVFVFDEGDTLELTEETGRFDEAEVEKLLRSRTETQEIFSFMAGGRQRFGGNWHLDYAAGYSYASERNPDYLVAEFIGEDIGIGYDLRPYGFRRPSLFGLDAAFSDASLYELDEVVEEDFRTRETERSGLLNLTRDVYFGRHSGFIKAGIKARLRTKTADLDALIYDGFGADYTLADFSVDRFDYPYGAFGPAVNASALRSFVNANRAGFDLDEEDSEEDSRVDDYRLDEDIYAAYLMARIDFDALRVLAGVRVERTRFDAVGTEFRIDEEFGTGDPEFRDLEASRRYRDVLPGLHLRYQLGANMILRSAYSQSIARPGFEAAAPRAEIEIEEDNGGFSREGEFGNPDLDPLRSQNLDLSWEFYPGRIGLVSVGVFHKRIRDFFVVADVAGTGAFVDFDEAIQTINGDRARVRGVELALVHQFRDLPAPWDGLLVAANYMRADSSASLPYRTESLPMPRQSDDVANLAIGYEKRGLSLRLAGTYRGRYLDELGDLEDSAFDRYVDRHLQVDFTARYRVSPGVQIYANAINLTDEPFYAYFQRRRFASQFEEYGRTFELGVNLSF